MSSAPTDDASGCDILVSPAAPSGPSIVAEPSLSASGSIIVPPSHPTPGYAKRVKGVALARSIVYGNSATAIKKSETENTHNWTLYVRGFNHEDISYYVSRVEFRLHESFAKPIRTVDCWPFEISEAGWGEFEVQIKVYFVDPNEKVLSLSHFLRLYPLEDSFMIRHPPGKGGTVVTEQYDEIVFYDPTLAMHSVLADAALEAASRAQFPPNSPYDYAEREELARLDEAKNSISAEIEKIRAKLDAKDSKRLSVPPFAATLSPPLGSQYVVLS